MSSSSTSPTSWRQERATWRAATTVSLGTAIEYYDFHLFAVMTVTLSPLFFPNHDPNTALLATLLIFGGGLVVRPIGGMFFGWYGDRFGRSRTLVFTVIGSGSACALIGFLPTHESIGVLAPLLLLFLRSAQGFFAGGEITGATTYLSEFAPPHRRGFFGAFNPAAATLGLTAATLISGVTTALASQYPMREWAWRVPFLVAVPLVVLCFRARLRIEDSPAFKEIARNNKVTKTPLREVVTQHSAALLQVICIGFAQVAGGSVCLVYVIIHMTRTLEYDPLSTSWLITIVTLVAALLMPLIGSFSDRIGRRRMLAFGLVGYIVLTPAAWHAASAGSFALAASAVAVTALPFVVVQAVSYPLYAELFPTHVRYSGVSLGFNLATLLGGAPAPFLAAWLTRATGDPVAPAYYVSAAALVGLISLATVSETVDRSLAPRPEEHGAVTPEK